MQVYIVPTRGQYSMDFSLNCDPPKLLNFDHAVELSRNSTGRRYVDGSEFHVEL